ncbi:MAG: hypothetical protein JWN62_2495, partial [Acidimicrobiales bacterium]|nr:hypothetical protein [Acidimicrobiales bacterium]
LIIPQSDRNGVHHSLDTSHFIDAYSVRDDLDGVASTRLVTFWSQKIQHRAELGNIGQHRHDPNVASELVFGGSGNTSQYMP